MSDHTKINFLSMWYSLRKLIIVWLKVKKASRKLLISNFNSNFLVWDTTLESYSNKFQSCLSVFKVFDHASSEFRLQRSTRQSLSEEFGTNLHQYQQLSFVSFLLYISWSREWTPRVYCAASNFSYHFRCLLYCYLLACAGGFFSISEIIFHVIR